jgi:SM-20-related protein
MTSATDTAPVEDAARVSVVEQVAAESCAIVPSFASAELVAALAAEARRRHAAGDFRAAGIGRGADRVERREMRGDALLWLDEQALAPPEQALFDALERLRIEFNRASFLGLFSFEGHYALYPPGTFYRRHRDRFRDDDARVLSCVLYLNAAWSAADGGELRIHFPDGGTRDVLPSGGTLVAFLADRYEHEVLPANRERLSIAGWFLRRS